MTNEYIRQNLVDEGLISAEAAERTRRLAFDPRKEADKVRRYEDASIRRMSRVCSDFIKLRESAILNVVADTELEFATNSDGANGEPTPARGPNDPHDEPEPADGPTEPFAAALCGDGADLDGGDNGARADAGTDYRIAIETGRDALRPLLAMTVDCPRPTLGGDRPAAGEKANNQPDAPIDEVGSPVDLPAWNPTSGLPRFAFDCFSGLLQGLLLLVCLWWAMASGQGEALREGPASKADVQVEPTAVKESGDRRLPEAGRVARPASASLNSSSGADLRAVGRASVPADQPVGLQPEPPGTEPAIEAANESRKRTNNTPIAQIKAMAICAGRRGGAGHLMVIAPPEDARRFKSGPRNSDRCAAKHRRRTKPRQSVRVARAPPWA